MFLLMRVRKEECQQDLGAWSEPKMKNVATLQLHTSYQYVICWSIAMDGATGLGTRWM